MRSILLKLADRTDRFFYAVDRWTRILSWFAIAGGLWIIATMLWRMP